jgi:hypothetical protein
MDIKVGEYVRINDDFRLIALGIGKVIRINQDTIYVKMNFELPIPFKIENIAKHSKNIIDLIEVGDFVNDYLVTDKYLFAGEKPVLETTGENTNCKCMCEEDIKTILTHEQYNQNCFKLDTK